MLGHRVLNVDDYLAIVKRRGWLVAVPTLLFPILAYALSYLIPPQYVSQTLVLIEQQTVPDEYVRPVITEDLDSRLASMKEQILSRSSLQPIIDHYNLYSTQKISIDDKIDLARKSIDIKPIISSITMSHGLPGFFISFKADNPRTAQQVCGEIQSLFVRQNLLSRAASVDQTTDFIKGQLDDAKRSLDDQEAKLALFQQKYFGKLPADAGNNVNLLTSLNSQLQAATQQLSSMEQQKSYMDTMFAQQTQSTPTASGNIAQAPQVQEADLQTLLAQETELSSHYKDDHPDVRAVRRKIENLRKQMAQAAATPVAPAPSGSTSAPTRAESPSAQQLRAQLKFADSAIQAKRKEQAQLLQQVHSYQERIQSSPQIEAEYKQLTRDHDTASTIYASLLNKLQQSKMATDLERRQQGEQFKVMDEPNLPDGPTYPKRQVFALGGLAAGLALGVVLVALLEYKDTALRTERDIWTFTQLPTLAVIAFSGDVAHIEPGKLARLKRLFSRKPKEVLADEAG